MSGLATPHVTAPSGPGSEQPASAAADTGVEVTRRMSVKDFPYPGAVEVASELALEAALAGAAFAPAASSFEVDRPDYKGATFGLEELKDLVKRGWLDRTDGVRPPGTPLWQSAQDHPELAKAFGLRQKLDARKVSASGGFGPFMCVQHPRTAATHRCNGCSRHFCGHCGNESEIRGIAVVLCVECDVPMVALG